jgi:hypothetical protein
VALATDVRLPSGNARDLLGSGAPGIKPFVAVSMPGAHFSPHVNVGYQWNGHSILAGNITGTTFSENSGGQALITNGSATTGKLPDQFFYSAGADFGINKRLSFAVDYLGQTLFNAPRVFQGQTYTQDILGGTGTLVLPTITGGVDNFGLNNGAVGFKANLAGNLLLTFDILFRMDNRGLRQDVTPLVALSYALGR